MILGTSEQSNNLEQGISSPRGAPKGLRIHIGLFGRRNVGKSSILNAITHQETSIVSPHAGTTTDPVDKAMELMALGPVLFIDTAGVDDEGALGALRIARTAKAFDRCDVGIIVTEAGTWGTYEDSIRKQLESRNIPFFVVLNKMDQYSGSSAHSALPPTLHEKISVCMTASQGVGVDNLRQALLDIAPDEFVNDPTIVGDIVPTGSTVVLVVPLDKAAPKGRLILPQVQVIRDLLDAGCIALTVRDAELPAALESLAQPPALVITDSQVFASVAKVVPETVPLTGFSVAFARFKGDLPTQTLGAIAIDQLTQESRVLIAEACTHHPTAEDIGTVKIPRLLRARVGEKLTIDHVRGADFPDDLAAYDLVIHCGGCMFNRRAMLSRIQACLVAQVPITNYGLVLAHLNGILLRSVQTFPGIPELLTSAKDHAEAANQNRKQASI